MELKNVGNTRIIQIYTKRFYTRYNTNEIYIFKILKSLHVASVIKNIRNSKLSCKFGI